MTNLDSVLLCTDCLTGAALELELDLDLQLAARALVRDLAASGSPGIDGLAILDAAHDCAVLRLDDSELGHDAFAAALERLAYLRAEAIARLVGIGETGAVLPVAADD